MPPTALKLFVHAHEVYELEYPAYWETLSKDEERSCGFGPKDRDDVGLWISIMPMSLDTDRLVDELPKMMQMAMDKAEAVNIRKDPSLKHVGLKADMTKAGEGGYYWILVGGDVVLFASSQVPVAEKEVWNPLFDALMSTLQITRDDELLYRKVAGEVLEKLIKLHPDQDFELDDKGIKGKNRVVYLSNVYREVKASPQRKDKIIKNFIEGLSQSASGDMGYEEWDECKGNILPVLKPRDYIREEGPTKHMLTQEWLADVLICYVIKSKKYFRFVTGWDVNRWGTTNEDLHKLALQNLAKLPWPRKLEGAREPNGGGRFILVETGDSLASSRLLHPELHKLFSGPLGSPFWAGIPDRDTLVVFSDRRQLKKRMIRQIGKDCRGSAYPITPTPFLVTRDGIAPEVQEPVPGAPPVKRLEPPPPDESITPREPD